jgi:hypothetical protein
MAGHDEVQFFIIMATEYLPELIMALLVMASPPLAVVTVVGFDCGEGGSIRLKGHGIW